MIVATSLNLDGPGRAFGLSNDGVWQKYHDLPRMVSSVPHSDGQSGIVLLTVFSSRAHFEARDELPIECNCLVIVRIYDLEIRAVADEAPALRFIALPAWRVAGRSSVRFSLPGQSAAALARSTAWQPLLKSNQAI